MVYNHHYIIVTLWSSNLAMGNPRTKNDDCHGALNRKIDRLTPGRYMFISFTKSWETRPRYFSF